jgi:hypothetical protein
MSKIVLYVCVALAVVSVAAWASDVIVERAPLAGPTAADNEHDAALELKYDNGTQQFFFVNYTGEGYWVGNDFDLSAISGYRAVTRLKVFSWGAWPNGKWDGFRLGIYAVSGGTPGSLLWGPTYFKPTRTTAGWCNYSIGWTLPPGNRMFLAAAEQYYDYPDVDPFAVDSNTTFMDHSWVYGSGSWVKLPGTAGYRNLMVRAVVNNITVDVAPTSVGRVKALYY